MTLTDLITAIKAAIYPNGSEEITGQILQNTLVQMAQTGVTPSGDPMHYAYVVCGATWNDSTGYWELNGLTDITNDQMREIYVRGIGSYQRTGDTWVSAYAQSSCRTNLPNSTTTGGGGIPLSLYETFYNATNLEKIVLAKNVAEIIYADKMYAFLPDAPKLTEVSNPINISQVPEWQVTRPFTFQAPNLTTLKLAALKTNINMGKLASLSLESLTYLVDNASNSGAITVTVHPTVYGYLTDQSGHPDWYALAQTAAGKQISFASA